ncbi:MAG: hypothetical protein M3Q08_16765 [Pseudomonadota bacterium]|nr:hypothetical protein [Pseudomonadota bacterium]
MMNFARTAFAQLWMLAALCACARSEPVPANPDEIEAAVKQANEAAATIEKDEATEDALDGL